jgi:proline iminopeptidase
MGRGLLDLPLAGALACFLAAGDGRATPAEATFQGPGGTLAYEVRGKGPGRPLVVINGGPGFDHTQLLLLPTAWDRLAQNRQVVFYDQRGTGRSSTLMPGAPDTLEEQVADLESLRGHLKAERIDLLGHSSGGFIAMAYAARHAAQLSHLILVDSQPPKIAGTRSLFGELFPEVVERQRAVESAKERGDKDAPGELRRLRRTMLFYSPDNRDLYLRLAQQLPFNQQVNTALSQDMERFDLTPDVKQFRMPVLVVTGRLDVVVPPSTAYTLHQEIPGSRFIVLERSGHLPFFEEPDAFARELDSFLAK